MFPPHPPQYVRFSCSLVPASPPSCQPRPPPQALGSGRSSCPGSSQDSHLHRFRPYHPASVSTINAEHFPDLTEARSPRQAGSSLWGLRLDHTQLRELMRDTDGAGEVVGGRARSTRPQYRSQRCSARTGGSRREGGAGLPHVRGQISVP